MQLTFYRESMAQTDASFLLLLCQKIYPWNLLLFAAKILYKLKAILFLAICFFISATAGAQEITLSYIIKRNGSPVGTMLVKELKAGNKISLWLDLDIKTSFVFTLKAKGLEEAVFENGILISSFIYQKLNGKEKVNKKTRLIKGVYVVDNKGKEENSQTKPIYYNMVCLYTHEPVKNTQVYSDKFQKYLGIQKVSEHQYKITFPNGDANKYYYENGTCTKIEVNNTFFSVVMELQN